MSILSRSSELKHPLRNSKKPSSDLMSNKGLSYVREKIRTPDLLVRSQTLYPAELRAHIIFVCFSYLCTSATKLIIAQRFLSVNNFFKIFQIIKMSTLNSTFFHVFIVLPFCTIRSLFYCIFSLLGSAIVRLPLLPTSHAPYFRSYASCFTSSSNSSPAE